VSDDPPSDGTNATEDHTEVTWRVLNHEIDEVRLLRDGVLIDRVDGTHGPVLGYTDLAGSDTVPRVETNVSVRVERTIITERFVNATGPNGTLLETVIKHDIEVLNETVTLSERVTGRVYNLRASVSYATYPDGTTGIAVFQSGPWQGYTLTTDETVHVRGVWRFYRLSRASASGLDPEGEARRIIL
jgi:hypothetical protein